jgi:hypothetical protein
MEPMTLGSPSSPSPSPFLPSFLMGESNPSTPIRNANTLSPSKGRSLAFSEYFDGFLKIKSIIDFLLFFSSIAHSVAWSEPLSLHWLPTGLRHPSTTVSNDPIAESKRQHVWSPNPRTFRLSEVGETKLSNAHKAHHANPTKPFDPGKLLPQSKRV